MGYNYQNTSTHPRLGFEIYYELTEKEPALIEQCNSGRNCIRFLDWDEVDSDQMLDTSTVCIWYQKGKRPRLSYKRNDQ